MYTQGEASKIRCCEEFPGTLLCIGSKCMAWRWVYSLRVVETKRNLEDNKLENCPTNKGYCGKAGKP